MLRDLDALAEAILTKKIEHITVLCGAGVSTSCGLPDFRSKDTGLFAQLAAEGMMPEELFSLKTFQKRPDLLYQVLPKLIPSPDARPSPTHMFFKLLDEKQLLNKVFTQNIDGFEHKTGLNPDKIVQVHGTLRFGYCKHNCPILMSDMLARAEESIDGVCHCPKHPNKICRPAIVLYDEAPLRRQYWQPVRLHLPKTDCLMVFGTSLRVEPFSLLIHQIDKNIPRVLFNRECVGTTPLLRSEGDSEVYAKIRPTVKNNPFSFSDETRQDIFCQGECDDSVWKLCRLLGWEDDLQRMYN